MSILLEAFPKLSHGLLSKIGYLPATYSFQYHYGNERRRLKSVTADTSNTRNSILQLQDETCQWHPETCDLIAGYENRISVPKFLFGENGLAARDGGVLGLALIWKDSRACQRGVIPIGEIGPWDIQPISFKAEVPFPAGTLRGNLVLQTVLYLKERGNPEERESFQASQTGTILGILDETTVIIEGNGSLFPIYEVYSPNQPLWWVRCEWENPLEDSFTEDNFCLYLNTAHRDYSALIGSENLKNSALLLEIISSALQILITKVLDDDTARESTIQGKNLVTGSVSSMVHYLLYVFDIVYDPDSPELLAMNIRSSLEKII